MADIILKPKGTNDVLPSDSYRWQYIEGVLRKAASDFGYSEIRFPTFEHTELFVRGVGDTTDVVQKEMFTFTDRGGRSITLRPEGTASVVRSYLENSLYGAGLPVKCFYIAPNFRGEQPQAGRYREFYQFGVEYLGSPCPSADAEVIALYAAILDRLGIKGTQLSINSIGCPECRPKFHAALRAYFESRRDELCRTCLDRLDKNPMRILDCKSPVCKEIAGDSPSCLDYLCSDCLEHFEKTKEMLGAMGIDFTIDPEIVRGLDYYTRTVFEFVSTDIGAQSAICGGGRYDGLIETLGGQPTPGLGFASGLERMMMVMDAQGIEFPKPEGCRIFLAALGGAAEVPVQKLVYDLRKLGVKAERDTTGRGLKAQMKYADRLGAAYSAVIVDNELSEGRARIKDMSTGSVFECLLTAEDIRNAVI
ncbi:MAG: histidine--tRNA ligase [Clostridiales bacterium]|nr:histidine--tRNA ligase [Clostridiales bacterium]